MAVPAISFVAGTLVAVYLFTFIVFAIVRVLTGISIQRLGLSSLRHITYAPNDALKVELRSVGLHFHRPTFAQWTWLSIVFEEVKVTLDLNVDVSIAKANGTIHAGRDAKPKPSRRETWARLMRLKEKLKDIHTIIRWLRMVDIVAHRCSCTLVDIGTVQLSSAIICVDTRPATVDRARLFSHNRLKGSQTRPAEWRATLRSVLFTPIDKDPIEILDHVALNIHGYLVRGQDGLRNLSISLKAGRVHVPYDDFRKSSKLVRRRHSSPAKPHYELADTVLSSLSEAHEFLHSVVHGIREVSIAIGFLGISKRVDTVQPSGQPLYLNASIKEVGLDLYRLDPATPAHSMYFSKDEVAHQALLTGLSMSVGVDMGHEHPDRLLYIPMTTATIRTTLPAKLLQFSTANGVLDLNSNVLFANLVVTSPSFDLDPAHLPVMFNAFPTSQRRRESGGLRLASKILPRAIIKLSVHEPVTRVSLPPVQVRKPDDYDFDLLISAISSIQIDIESAHNSANDAKYNASANLRINSHRLYYQTASREKHDLLIADSMDAKAKLTSDPDVLVVASANFQTFSLLMIRPEIGEAIKQIVHQLRSDYKSDKISRPSSKDGTSFIRKLPIWLHGFDVTASDLNVELAGDDPRLSSTLRGFALHLESFRTEYKAHKDNVPETKVRHRHPTRRDEVQTPATPMSPVRRKAIHGDGTDGRRLAIHFRGFEGFVIEQTAVWEQQPSISIPRAEIAFTTSHDIQGPVLHANTVVRNILFQYSLFRHYAIGVAMTTLRHMLSRPQRATKVDVKHEAESPSVATAPEFIAADLRISFIQIKAQMPSDPNLMMHLAILEAGRHRWHTPFVKAESIRLLATAPALPKVWARVVTIRNPRVDFREHKRKHAGAIRLERSIDVTMHAIRGAVPHQLVMHKIFDNIVNMLKTIKQLHHRFKTGSDEYILEKFPESAKVVPRITVRSNLLAFELEDGAFDWKLGVIYRAGLVEQKQREAREEAFNHKVKLIRAQAAKHESTRLRPGSPASNERGRARSAGPARRESRNRHHSRSHSENRGRSMRYDADDCHQFSGFAKTSVDEAWERLQTYNAESWKKRIDRAFTFQRDAMQDIRTLIWGLEDVPHYPDQQESILQLSARPALASLFMSDFNMIIDKPSFPLQDLPQFMHRVGKGLPLDTKFGLLVPLYVQFDVGELRANLRDYPLPLLHIPALKPGQSPKLPSWSLKSDFVIAEEFRDYESSRDLQVLVVPPEKLRPGGKKTGGFAIDVRRTVSPVKTYSDIKLEIHTARDTKITWGTSYQPAIQDTMQVIEGFTKPQLDPSERVGFWDKIRLSFHSRLNIAWTGGGDVHFMLKGSRDPYVVTGRGSGFVMVWRNNVRWNIWGHDDPQRFMTVESGDYLLAIPDFISYARKSSPELTAHGAKTRAKPDTLEFKKVIMKLSGNVQWRAGLVFERNLKEGGRSMEFEPHYTVTLKNPAHVKGLRHDSSYDAFSGFRSHHIHMSIAVSAPSDRDWSDTSLGPSTNYNSVHLSPRAFTHFFSWWELFSGNMSLPIRQGRLFPGVDKSGKKFGRHLATIKYSLLLSPLMISHVYLHKDPNEFSDDYVSATGLKLRQDSFILDLHQRREEFTSDVKGHNKKVHTTGMRLNQALFDMVKADVRAVSMGITGTNVDSIKKASPEQLKETNQRSSARTLDPTDFHIPDNDLAWIDVDDFVELDWTLPVDQHAKTSILPLAYSPRFTYRRQTDHGGTISGDPNRHSPFGYEDTHFCLMPSASDSREVQIQLIKERLAQIDVLLEDHGRAIGEQELKVVKEVPDKTEIVKQLQELREHGANYERKKEFLRSMAQNLEQRLNQHEKHKALDDTLHREASSGEQESSNRPAYGSAHDPAAPPLAEHVTDFNNRFIVHNAQIKWNNSLRNTMLRYIHQVSQRRGFIYYLSRPAVKFILDIIEEQAKSSKKAASAQRPSEPLSPGSVEDDDGIQDRIQQLLADGRDFVNADDPDSANADSKSSTVPNQGGNEDVSHAFLVQNTYHVRLVAPQIQLQSDKNTKAVALVAARGMRLQVFQIMDRDRISDPVSGLVQTRWALDMDNMQSFVTTRQALSEKFISIYSANSYGAPLGSHWPPWAPIEAMFDFDSQTYGFDRVVMRTSANLRYDKYNKLRLKYNDNVSENTLEVRKDDPSETRMDQITGNFPHIRAICDSTQYYALYMIGMDLIMWTEPLEKNRNERLEKIMLASDFSDLRGAPEMVTMLQSRIHALNEIKTHFHVNEDALDSQGWKDRLAMEQDLATCEDELFFLMKAIMTSQRKNDDRVESARGIGVIRYSLTASEIVWHLTQEEGVPLAEFQLRRAAFDRTDKSDGSNVNVIEVDQIKGLSLLPNAIYPETISAHTDGVQSHAKAGRMLHVSWQQLEAIAGINVVDHFEIVLHPLKIQLEYAIGKRIFEYIFPSVGSGEDGSSPFMIRHSAPQNDDDDLEETSHVDRETVDKALQEQPSGSSYGVGRLEQRLQPTTRLQDGGQKAKHGPLGIHLRDPWHRHEQRMSLSATTISGKTLQGKRSNDVISLGRESSRPASVSTNSEDKRKHFSITKRRDGSVESRRTRTTTNGDGADDLTQMMKRASNYMTLAYFKIPSVVLCLSYKGKGNRNIEDVHNLVFRMPTLEYRNKTWSNLDLALALKKDVIRALVSHTGAIIGNKFSHHRYNKSQQSKLRELASSSVVLSSSDVSRAQSSATSSRFALYDGSSPRNSEAESDIPLAHAASWASEFSDSNQIRAYGDINGQGVQDDDSVEGESSSKRFHFPRHLSELRLKTPKTRESFAGEEAQDSPDSKAEGSTSRRGTIVRKLLQTLDK